METHVLQGPDDMALYGFFEDGEQKIDGKSIKRSVSGENYTLFPFLFYPLKEEVQIFLQVETHMFQGLADMVFYRFYRYMELVRNIFVGEFLHPALYKHSFALFGQEVDSVPDLFRQFFRNYIRRIIVGQCLIIDKILDWFVLSIQRQLSGPFSQIVQTAILCHFKKVAVEVFLIYLQLLSFLPQLNKNFLYYFLGVLLLAHIVFGYMQKPVMV